MENEDDDTMTKLPLMTRMLCAGLVLLCGIPLAASAEADPIAVDSAMYDDPRIEIPPPVTVFSPRLKPLWLQALAQPEADLQRLAADTIARAHRLGMPGLSDTAGPLRATLDAAERSRVVRLAAARALVVLDARDAAPSLWSQARTEGLAMAQLVEPALARWDYAPARAVWLERISEPGAPQQLRLLAIQGLAGVGERQAVPRLRELALDSSATADVRLQAARALGGLAPGGLEEDARRLGGLEARGAGGTRGADGRPAVLDRLVAASMLTGARGPDAERLLSDIAVDAEPAVAAVALRRLLEIDPALVLPLAEGAVGRDDANVRRLGAEALVAVPTPERVAVLAVLLDDPHPEVRGYVRESLFELAAQPALEPAVRDAGMEMLGRPGWRGLEQSALLLAALDHKPAAGRLVELLDFPRPEVFVTAAWALGRLAVEETLPPLFDKAEQATQRLLAEGAESLPHEEREPTFDQVSQIFQTFGRMDYRPAEALLRRYVPKNHALGSESRAAAVWALGHFHAGRPHPELVPELAERMTDLNPFDPEDGQVRFMAAVSLGRMRAEEALPKLRDTYRPGTLDLVGNAAGWAIHQITGEEIPRPEPEKKGVTAWFLEPLD